MSQKTAPTRTKSPRPKHPRWTAEEKEVRRLLLRASEVAGVPAEELLNKGLRSYFENLVAIGAVVADAARKASKRSGRCVCCNQSSKEASHAKRA